VPEIGLLFGVIFHKLEGVECRRFDVGVERVVLRINGVRPEDADSISVAGPGSENRTRFLDLLGVCGGVDIP